MILNREQSRRVDLLAVECFGMSGLVLMENAGRGAVDVMQAVGLVSKAVGGGPVAIFCGKGNNGGDGFVMARHLAARGCEVSVALFCESGELRGDAATNFEIVRCAGLPWREFGCDVSDAQLDCFAKEAACVVDALLGTGSQGEPRSPYDRAIAAINRRRVPIVAVDLPSGLDCDSGRPSTATVRAAHTITFVAAKPGLVMPSAAEYVGRLHVVDLGLPPRLFDEFRS